MPIKAYILIVSDPVKTKNVTKQLKDIPSITSIAEVMGPYDIVVELSVESLTEIPPILGEKVRTIDGIQNTTSLVTLPE